jgi:hypothetical protein
MKEHPMKKVIPQSLFQLIALGSLVLLIVIAITWTRNQEGLYPVVRDVLSGVLADVGEASLITLVGGFFTFIVLALPWMVVMFILREYTQGMATMKDEVASLKGQPLAPELQPSPRQTKIRQGIFGIILGFVLILMNLLILDSGDGVFFWVLAGAVPVSIIVGIVYLAQGLAMKDR